MERYVVWGTGKQAKRILDLYMSNFFDVDHSIEYFVDNDEKKWGGQFLGKEICPPSRLLNNEFDKIFIASIFVHEIRLQLICSLSVDREKIIFEDDIRYEIYKKYIHSDIKNKKLLIVGDSEGYQFISGRYGGIFNNIVGVVDFSNIESAVVRAFDYVFIMNPMGVKRNGVDREQGRVAVEQDLIKRLVKRWNVSRDKIMTDGDYRAIVSFPYKVCYGDENEDKIFFVIRVSGANGLAAIMMRVWEGCMTARSMGYIPIVDAARAYNPYLNSDEVGSVNAWEKFFEQPKGYSLKDISHSSNVWISPEDQSLKGALAGKSEFSETFRAKPEMEKRARECLQYIKGNGEKILAVKYRGSDYITLKPYNHPIQPTIEECIKKVEEKIEEWGGSGGYDKIFLSTESQEAIVAFEQKFGNKVCYIPKKRISDDVKGSTVEEYKKIEDPYESAVLYYAEMYVTASCDSLISSQCSSTPVVLNMNKDLYEHVYIFDLGIYGIDDI